MPDEWSEWVKIYSQMDEVSRKEMTGLMRGRIRPRMRGRRADWWRGFSEKVEAPWLRLRPTWLRMHPTPLPLRLPLIHAVLSFLCLSLLPARPLSIPTALGIATVLIVYLQILAYRTGYRLNV